MRMVAEQVATQIPPDTAKGKTILVVDDDNTNRLVLQTLLAQSGYRVIVACNGAEAVDMFSRNSPDVVLMDVMMPVMDGYEATRQIKALAGECYVPVLFLTALTDDRALARCIEAGGNDFLTKPYSKSILKLRLDAALRTRELYTQLAQHAATIQQHNDHLHQEQESAERIFRNMVHRGALQDSCFHYQISPAALFNGDLLLAARKPEGGYRVLVGDFTGHGLPAAVGAIPVAETFYAMTARGKSLAEFMTETNRKLKLILPTGIFLAVCVLDVSSTQVEIWNGGMPDVLLRHGASGVVTLYPSQHMAAGILPESAFDTHIQIIPLQQGDRLYVYSDGVTEVMNASDELFGMERLMATLQGADAAGDGIGRILLALQSFAEQTTQHDDMTLIEILPDQIF
jgi:two-component system, HptB-dependent secretion and biofilm response regulator